MNTAHDHESRIDVVSACPMRTASLIWQSRPGMWILTVVTKATYVLTPGESPLATDQDEPHEADGYWNDDETLSLHVASDLAPFKRNADVILVGRAFAPEGLPVRSLVVRLAAAGMDKRATVFGDRAWSSSGDVGDAAPFATMGLRWERAAGGPSTSNPVGVPMGLVDAPQRARTASIPNVQSPGVYLARRGETLAPVGFGPIAPHWPGRAEKVSRHATSRGVVEWIDRALPDDLDASYFNVAPPDQQVALIRSDECIVLENLHAAHKRLTTSLMGLEPRGVVTRSAGAGELHFRCDTLSIDTDRGRCSLVWRAQVALAHRHEAGQVLVTTSTRDPHQGATMTLVGRIEVEPALPFLDHANAPPGGSQTEEAQAGASEVVEGVNGTATGTILIATGLPSTGARPRVDGATTMPLPLAPATAILPFATKLALVDDAIGAVAAVAPEWQEPEEAKPAAPLDWRYDIPPPPLVGSYEAEARAASGVDSPELPPQPTEAETTEETPPVETPVLLSIEQFSVVAATLAERRTPRGETLRANELRERDWSANEARWAEALRQESARGSTKLRSAGDGAYVGAVERFRGPITAFEYARLTIALERGQTQLVLDELKIQRPALMRVIRLWAKRVALDAQLADEVKSALAALRTA